MGRGTEPPHWEGAREHPSPNPTSLGASILDRAFGVRPSAPNDNPGSASGDLNHYSVKLASGLNAIKISSRSFIAVL